MQSKPHTGCSPLDPPTCSQRMKREGAAAVGPPSPATLRTRRGHLRGVPACGMHARGSKRLALTTSGQWPPSRTHPGHARHNQPGGSRWRKGVPSPSTGPASSPSHHDLKTQTLKKGCHRAGVHCMDMTGVHRPSIARTTPSLSRPRVPAGNHDLALAPDGWGTDLGQLGTAPPHSAN